MQYSPSQTLSKLLTAQIIMQCTITQQSTVVCEVQYSSLAASTLDSQYRCSTVVAVLQKSTFCALCSLMANECQGDNKHPVPYNVRQSTVQYCSLLYCVGDISVRLWSRSVEFFYTTYSHILQYRTVRTVFLYSQPSVEKEHLKGVRQQQNSKFSRLLVLCGAQQHST